MTENNEHEKAIAVSEKPVKCFECRYNEFESSEAGSWRCKHCLQVYRRVF